MKESISDARMDTEPVMNRATDLIRMSVMATVTAAHPAVLTHLE
jgi:hypothetical protein